MSKFVKYISVEDLKNLVIKENRQNILIAKRNNLGISAIKVAEKVGISKQAYSKIESNDRTGANYMNKIQEVLSLSDNEIKAITSYDGNLIDDAKKYALSIAKEYINDISTIASFYHQTHKIDKDYKYLASVYLSLFFNLKYEWEENPSKPTLKNYLSITNDIIEWFKNKFNFFEDEITYGESFYLRNIIYAAFEEQYSNYAPFKITQTSNDYTEIASKIDFNYNSNKIPPYEHFRALISKYDVKQEFLDKIGFSNSYILKLQEGHKPFSAEVIYRLAKILQITPADASILLGNTDQELVSSIIKAEYKNIISTIPAYMKSIMIILESKLHLGLDLCYTSSNTFNTFLCSEVTGNSVDLFKFEFFLSFFNILIKYDHSILVSNKGDYDTRCIITHNNQIKETSILDVQKLANEFNDFNKELYTKYFKFIKRQNQNESC